MAFSYSKISLYKGGIIMLRDNNDSKLQTSDPNEITYESMKKIENDEDIFGPFDSVEELMEALNS